ATGTIALATVSTGNVLANISGASAAPSPNTLTAIMDAVVGNVRGSVAYRGGTVWTTLPPDSAAGKYLKTQGPGGDTIWDSPPGAAPSPASAPAPASRAGRSPRAAASRWRRSPTI